MAVDRSRFRSRSRSRRGGRVAVLAVTFLCLLSLTFLFGFLVGREWATWQPRDARGGKERQTVRADRAPAPKTAADANDQAGRLPQIQERLTFYRTLAAPPNPGPKAPDGKPPAREASGQSWTLQVGAYRNRNQALALQRSLEAAGYDAYLTTVPGQDGVVHHRVRVGTYPTRAAAEKVSEQLRTGRSLTPLVVPW